MRTLIGPSAIPFSNLRDSPKRLHGSSAASDDTATRSAPSELPNEEAGSESVEEVKTQRQSSLQEPGPTLSSSPLPTEPATPQILPASNISMPDTPTPLSRSSSVRAIAPQSTRRIPSTKSDTPALSAKDHCSRFFLDFSVFPGWRRKFSEEDAICDAGSTEPVTMPKAEPRVSYPVFDKSFFQRYKACSNPVAPKRPHTCSAGMDIDDCRAEKTKRRKLKAEAEAAKSNGDASSEETTPLMANKESLLPRVAHHDNTPATEEHGELDSNTDSDHDAKNKDPQEWQVL